MVPTVRIRLTKHESGRLVTYFNSQIEGKVHKHNVRNELIVMAEFYEKLFNKAVKQRFSYKSSPIVYQFPLSIARILHERLQYNCPDQECQNILNSLDQQLVNIGMKPEYPKQLSI